MMLQRTFCHLDSANATVRITFFDSSSTFNIIKPGLLCEKMKKMQLELSQDSGSCCRYTLGSNAEHHGLWRSSSVLHPVWTAEQPQTTLYFFIAVFPVLTLSLLWFITVIISITISNVIIIIHLLLVPIFV